MESAQSEDNLEGKAGGSNPSLSVVANGSRAYSSDDLRSMGAPMSGPSGLPKPHAATPPAPNFTSVIAVASVSAFDHIQGLMACACLPGEC